MISTRDTALLQKRQLEWILLQIAQESSYPKSSELTEITLNGVKLSNHSDLNQKGYTIRDLGNGDYAVNINRLQKGKVIVKGL